MVQAYGQPAGAPQGWARVHLVRGQSSGAVWQVDQSVPQARLAVGSDPAAGWSVSAFGVLPMHFELYWDGRSLFAADTQRVGGVTVNGQPLGAEWVPLKSRTEIVFGQAALRLETSADSPAQLQSDPSVAKRISVTELSGEINAESTRIAEPMFDPPSLAGERTMIAEELSGSPAITAPPGRGGAAPSQRPPPPPMARPRLGGSPGGREVARTAPGGVEAAPPPEATRMLSLDEVPPSQQPLLGGPPGAPFGGAAAQPPAFASGSAAPSFGGGPPPPNLAPPAAGGFAPPPSFDQAAAAAPIKAGPKVPPRTIALAAVAVLAVVALLVLGGSGEEEVVVPPPVAAAPPPVVPTAPVPGAPVPAPMPGAPVPGAPVAGAIPAPGAAGIPPLPPPLPGAPPPVPGAPPPPGTASGAGIPPLGAPAVAPPVAPPPLAIPTPPPAAPPPAPATGEPVVDPATLGPTDERLAADLVIAGRYSEALPRYQALMAAHPERSEYAAMVGVLTDRIRELSCVGGLTPDGRPCTTGGVP